MKTTSEIGRNGEKSATLFLIDKGFDITALNYHSRFGEIDIIAENDEYILFVEVKTRNERAMYTAKEAVDKRKQKKIILTALQFLGQTGCEKQPRFDVIEVYNKKGVFSKKEVINHIENAFEPEEGSDAIF